MDTDTDTTTEHFYDLTGMAPGAEDLLANVSILLAKLAAGTLMVYFTLQELRQELQKLRKRGSVS